MTHDQRQRRSRDQERFNKRLVGYFEALQIVPQLLSDEADSEEHGAIGSIGHIQPLLPLVLRALSSDFALAVDAHGRILYAIPQGSGLADRTLPMTQAFQRLFSGQEQDVVISTPDDGPSPLSEALRAQFLLAAPWRVPTGVFVVVVGRYSPDADPYPAADVAFLHAIARVAETAAVSVKQAERRHARDDYEWASALGDWENLSRTSRAYLIAAWNSLSQNKRDAVLADYLDAEYSRRMARSSRSDGSDTEKRNPKVGQGSTSTDGWEKLLSEIELTFSDTEPKSTRIRFRSSEEQFDLEDLATYPRTALAIARIALSTGYLKVGGGARSGSESLPKEKATTLGACAPELRLGELPKQLQALVAKSEAPQPRDGQAAVQLREARVRTIWQEMHYLARAALQEPTPERVARIVQIYKEAHQDTSDIIQDFLGASHTHGELQVDSDWLVAWLGLNILCSDRLALYYGLPSIKRSVPPGVRPTPPGPLALVRYLAHLSHHILYVLHCYRQEKRWAALEGKVPKYELRPFPFADTPIDLSSSRSEALLFILSEYAYREIGVDRELQLFERLLRQLTYQLPFYASSDWYRDHLYHVIDVCLLGELLWRCRLPSGGGQPRILGAVVGTMLAAQGTDDPLDRALRNWYVAALCHDIGYAVEYTDKLLGPVHGLDGIGLDRLSEELKRGLDGGERAISQAIEGLLPVDPTELTSTPAMELRKILADVKRTDHGIAGWLQLKKWLKTVRLPDDAYDPALRAVLRHNLPGQHVDLMKEPLTFMLILVDHLQDWGRPRMGTDPLARTIMEALRFSERPILRSKVFSEKLNIKGIRMASTGGIAWPEIVGNQVEFELPCVEARQGDFEPVVAWLQFCQDLQGLAYKTQEMNFPLLITMRHQTSQIWNAFSWQPLEMDLIEEFANTDERAAYLAEWVAYARNKERGIEYCDQGNGKERFTIKLHEIAQPLRRGLSDNLWKTFIRWKWRWLAQKYVTLGLGPWFPTLTD